MVAPSPQTLAIEVAPTVVNVLLVDTTQRNSTGALPGRAGCCWPEGKDHAVFEKDLHTKDELVGASPLLPKATLLFNSSHGSAAWVSDDSDPPNSISWYAMGTALQTSVDYGPANPVRRPRLNMAFLYSCECGKTAYAPSLFGPTAVNQAGFAFRVPVFTTLKPGDLGVLPYNDESGTITMVQATLDSHVTSLLGMLQTGNSADEALLEANQRFPPRTSIGVDPARPSINRMAVTRILRSGDGGARIGSVYRPEVAGSYVAYGDQVIVLRPAAPVQ